MSTGKQDNRRSASFLKQGSLLAMASLVVRLIGMIYRIPMANILGDGNGIYAVAFDIYDIILIISSYSLPLALSKIISSQNSRREYRNMGKTFRLSLWFAVLSGGVFGTALFVCAGWIETHIYPAYLGLRIPLRVLAPTIFIVALLGVFRGFFQGKNTMVPTAVSQVLEQVVNAIVSVSAAYLFMKWNADSLVRSAWGAAGGTLGTCLGAMTALLLVVFVYYIYRPVPKKNERRDRSRRVYSSAHIYRILFLTILPIILSQTVYQVSGLIDYYLFSDVMGAKGVDARTISALTGIYSSNYRTLTSVPIAISTSIASSMIPSAVAAYTQRDMGQVKYNILSGIKFNMIIAFPCAMGYTILGQGIVRMLFPSMNYVLGGHLMMAGSAAIIFYAVSNVTGSALQSIDKMRVPVINSAISLVLHVLIVLLLLKFTGLGIYVLIIGNVTFPVVVGILNIISLYRCLPGFRLKPLKTFFVPLSASLWMAIAVIVVYTLTSRLFGMAAGEYATNALAVLVSLAVAVFVYFVVFLKLRGMTRQELYDFPMGRRLYVVARKLRLMK